MSKLARWSAGGLVLLAACRGALGIDPGQSRDNPAVTPTSADDGGGSDGGPNAGGDDAGDGDVPVVPTKTTVERSKCARDGLGFDPTREECVPCEALPADATVVHVDLLSPPVAATLLGSAACPLPAIADAIAYAALHPKATRIEVGPGTYGAATGESFPLNVQGLALVGAGAALTTIQGEGLFQPESGGTAKDGELVTATLRTGSDRAPSLVQDLRIVPKNAVATTGAQRFGIACDRGAQLEPGTTAAATTVLQGVVVERGYEVGVHVTGASNKTRASGCSMRIEASEIRTQTARAILVQGISPSEDNEDVGAPVALDLGGDTAASGVRLAGVDASQGRGLEEWGGIARLRLRNVTATDLSYGVVIGTLATEQDVSIRTSTFTRSTVGVCVSCGGALKALEDSVFTQNDSAVILMSGDWCARIRDPYIARARRNRFVGNRVALTLQESGTNADPASFRKKSDFGTKDDAGENVFRCNSSSAGTSPGADVNVNRAVKRAGLLAVGNFWDHVGSDGRPTVVSAPAALEDGVDVWLDAPNAGVDVSDAQRGAAIECPADRTPGAAAP